MSEIIDLAAATRALAMEYPNATYDTTYAGCDYFSGEVKHGPPGVEGCIVGQAAQRIDLGKLFTESPTQTVDDVLDAVGPEEVVALNFLVDIQGHQDDGMPWGEALDHIESEGM